MEAWPDELQCLWLFHINPTQAIYSTSNGDRINTTVLQQQPIDLMQKQNDQPLSLWKGQDDVGIFKASQGGGNVFSYK